MRIGMMLRSLDERGGIGVYTSNLVEELLSLDSRNQYVLFYRNSANLGRFGHYGNVTEYLVKAPNKAFWDQIAIPYACWREKVDVVFHPKFTAPLLAPCKAVMVVHGADWFISEQARYYANLDIWYIRLMMPLYFKKCSTVISVSQLTTANFNRILRLPSEKVKTVYFGPARNFRRITDQAVHQTVRQRYGLPDKFILTLTKRGGDERKNLGQMLKAYELYHKQVDDPHKLVIGGQDCHLYREEYDISENGYGRDIYFPGWIDQEDLPAVYSQAGLYLYPSNVEAFPIPVTEAMACGTPIITSDANGLREIAADAALLVNPQSPREISEAICQVLSDPNLQAFLSLKGLARSSHFTWEKCARGTLDILEGTVQ